MRATRDGPYVLEATGCQLTQIRAKHSLMNLYLEYKYDAL